MGKGLKRKLPWGPEGGSTEPGSSVYEIQRQSVLDISLDKFQRSQALAEPSLLRSVLISNTLRQIQDEIQLEALCPVPVGGALEPRLQGEAPPIRPLGSEEACEDWMALSYEEDFSLSSAVSSILKELDTVIDGGPAAVAARTPLGSIENLPGEAGPRQEWGTGHPWRAERRGEAVVFGSFEVLRSSYLRDVALDDLFLDIDTSACERDARALCGSAGDELLKILPALTSPAGPAFSHGPNARDLNDLEHIMEILVGS